MAKHPKTETREVQVNRVNPDGTIEEGIKTTMTTTIPEPIKVRIKVRETEPNTKTFNVRVEKTEPETKTFDVRVEKTEPKTKTFKVQHKQRQVTKNAPSEINQELGVVPTVFC